MEDRLVSTSMKILRLLYNKELGTNQIIEQTSSDRSYILKIRDALAAAGLIESKSRKIGVKRKTKLSNLGKDLIQLIINIDEYYKTYDLMLKNLVELLLMVNNENQTDKLEGKESQKENIINLYPKFFEKSREYMKFYSNSLEKIFNSIIILLFKNNYVPNKKNEIITHILKEIILNVILKYNKIINDRELKRETISIINIEKTSQLDALFNIGVGSPYKIPENKIDLVKQMFKSQIAVINPDIDSVKTWINILEEDIVKEKNLKETAFNCLLLAYKEYSEKYLTST